MDPGIVAQAGDVFGRASSRPFSVEVPGHDRHEGDEDIGLVETRARQLRERGGPGCAGPGSQIEQMLRLAGEQVARNVQEARWAADELAAAARADAAGLLAAAEGEAAKLRAAAVREAGDLRGSAEREADAIRASALREAGEL